MDKKFFKIVMIVGVPTLLLAFQNCAKLGTNGIAIDDQTLALEQVAVVDQPSSEVIDQGAAVSEEDDVEQTPIVNNDDDSIVDEPQQQEPSYNEVPPVIVGGSSSPSNPSCGGPVVITGTSTQQVIIDGATVSNTNGVQTIPNMPAIPNIAAAPIPAASAQAATDQDVAEAIRLCKGEEALSAAADNLDLVYNHEVVSLDAKNVEGVKGNHGVVLLRSSQGNGVVGDVKVNHSKVILCDFKSVKSIKGPHNVVIVVGAKIAEVAVEHSVVILVNSSAEKIKGVQSVVKNYSLK